MTYDQYREIFRIIDDSLWTDIAGNGSGLILSPLDARLDKMRQRCEEAKKIISEYIDRCSEMMAAMVTCEAFRRFPAPTAPENPPTTEDRIPSLLSMLAALAADEAARVADDPAE